MASDDAVLRYVPQGTWSLVGLAIMPRAHTTGRATLFRPGEIRLVNPHRIPRNRRSPV